MLITPLSFSNVSHLAIKLYGPLAAGPRVELGNTVPEHIGWQSWGKGVIPRKYQGVAGSLQSQVICAKIEHFPALDYVETSPVAQRVKHLPAVQDAWVQSLGQEDPLEKEMAPHSSTLSWKIPWTEEPARLQSMGLQRVRHNWATSPRVFLIPSPNRFFYWRQGWGFTLKNKGWSLSTWQLQGVKHLGWVIVVGREKVMLTNTINESNDFVIHCWEKNESNFLDWLS